MAAPAPKTMASVNQEASLYLIEQYKNLPELWNPQHSHYTFKVRRNESWAKLAQIMNMTVDEVRRKVNSLLATYRRSRAKFLSNGTPKWFGFEKMSFMLDKDMAKVKLVDGADQQQDFVSDDDTSSEDDGDLAGDLIKFERGSGESPVHTNTNTLPSLYSSRKQPPPQITVLKRKFDHPGGSSYVDVGDGHGGLAGGQVRDALSVLERAMEVSSKAFKRDDCDVYGQHVANKLRHYCKKTRDLVEHEINSILFNADMGLLNRDSVEIKVLSSSNGVPSEVQYSSGPGLTTTQQTPQAATEQTQSIVVTHPDGTQQTIS